MPEQVIVAHYHELWLKGGNRNFFLAKLITAVRAALEGLPVEGIAGRRTGWSSSWGLERQVTEALSGWNASWGSRNFAVARTVDRSGEHALEDIARVAWE